MTLGNGCSSLDDSFLSETKRVSVGSRAKDKTITGKDMEDLREMKLLEVSSM